ncbi:aryl-sulfate sulfotransferase [Winogradskyella sp.]|uniref:aryl-sulfate sulfotransferase n=1 Tax=Winogradskyella sp. TaxID=1883156 RepID=UPI003AB8CBDB
MLKKIIFTLLITINVSYSQNTIGTTLISEGVADGYTLFSAFTETYLINNCGEIINQWSSEFPPGNAVHLLENGNILRAGRTESSDIVFGGQGGVIELFDWEGNLTWQYFYDNSTMRQHHDVFPMPNGNVLILAVTKITNSEALQLGRNPSLLNEDILYNEQIIEVTPIGEDSAEIVWKWNIMDHVIQDFDDEKDNFGDIALHPEKLNINFLNGGDGGANWLHFNSINYNPILDQIIISSRNLSEFYIIDHSTTTEEAATGEGGIYNKGGDFLYRWGNPQAYNQGDESDRQLYGQHSPHFIKPGLLDENKILLFNNGRGRLPLFSEAYIVNPETDSPGVYSYDTGSAYGPISPDYTYGSSTGALNFYSGILSSAQRLPNGNTLICEGINGRFFEITTTEEVVWEYINPINTSNGNIISQGTNPSTYSNTSFRAQKYHIDYPAFTNRDLTPSAPIELNSNITACKNLSVSNYETLITKVYPNPTSGSLKIISELAIDKIDVYNVIGKKIYTTTSNTIDLYNQPNGIYFLQIYSDTNIISKKVAKN